MDASDRKNALDVAQPEMDRAAGEAITFASAPGESVEWTTLGLVGKYHVERVDGKPLAGGCFVLEYGDPLVREALAAYARSASEAGYLQLAKDLTAICDRLRDYPKPARGDVWRVSNVGKVYVQPGAPAPDPEAEERAHLDALGIGMDVGEARIRGILPPKSDPEQPIATYDASGVRAEDVRGGRMVDHLVEVAVEVADWKDQADQAEPEHRFVRVPLGVLLELEYAAERLRQEAT